MKRLVLSIVLGGFFAPSLAFADDTVSEKRATEIFVHVSGDATAISGDTGSGMKVTCEAPCDRKMPADAEYRVLAHGGSSAPFMLHRDERRIDVAAQPASPGRTLGLVLTALGGVAIGVGAGTLLYGDLDRYQLGAAGTVSWGYVGIYPTVTDVGPNTGVMTAGAITLGVGVLALVTGLILYGTSHKANVVQTALTF